MFNAEDYALLYRETPLDTLRKAVECRDAACLIWPHYRDMRCNGGVGRGRVKWKGRDQFVHVVVCEILNGPRPPGYHASHSCHNGAGGCVNGSHLEWLPSEQNLALNRGRPTKDKKLNPVAVKEIRAMHACGLFSHGEIGRRFGVSKSAIRSVLSGHNWGWVE